MDCHMTCAGPTRSMKKISIFFCATGDLAALSCEMVNV